MESTLGETIRSARKRLGISQAEVGGWIAKTQQAIDLYEKNERQPSLIDLAIIAERLGLPDEVRFFIKADRTVRHERARAGATDPEEAYRYILAFAAAMDAQLAELAETVALLTVKTAALETRAPER